MEASQPAPQGSWWQRRQRWQQWTIGIVGVLVLLGIGSAMGESNSSSEEDKLKEEVASLKTELAEAETQTAKAEAGGGESEEAVSEVEEETAAEVKAEAEEEAEEEEASTPKSTMSDGTWVRGVDYVVGTYRAPGGSLCYWEQDKKPGGEAAGEGFNSHYGTGEKNILLEITSPYFKTESCGTWELVEAG